MKLVKTSVACSLNITHGSIISSIDSECRHDNLVWEMFRKRQADKLKFAQLRQVWDANWSDGHFLAELLQFCVQSGISNGNGIYTNADFPFELNLLIIFSSFLFFLCAFSIFHSFEMHATIEKYFIQKLSKWTILSKSQMSKCVDQTQCVLERTLPFNSLAVDPFQWRWRKKLNKLQSKRERMKRKRFEIVKI